MTSRQEQKGCGRRIAHATDQKAGTGGKTAETTTHRGREHSAHYPVARRETERMALAEGERAPRRGMPEEFPTFLQEAVAPVYNPANAAK